MEHGSVIDPAVVTYLCNRAMNCPPGAFVEVGVYRGDSGFYLAHAAEMQKRPCYLYDTFEGMPHQAWDDPHPVGDFADTSYEAVKARIPYATVVKGVFPSSAVEMGPIAFVHLDADQYQSYADTLDYFASRMVKKGIIWLDDATGLPGAGRATHEFCAAHPGLLRADRLYLEF